MEDHTEVFDLIYDLYQCGDRGRCAAGKIDRESFVRTSDGELIELRENQARIYAGLRAVVGDIPLIEESPVVPTEVALADRYITVTYLYAAGYRWHAQKREYKSGKKELSEFADVTISTIEKYINRAEKDAMEKRIDGRYSAGGWR